MVLNLDEEKLARQNGEEPSPDDRSAVVTSREKILSRLNFLRLGIVGSFSILAVKMATMQLTAKPEEKQATARPRTADITVKAPRGLIYDSTGKLLVRNVPTYSVTVTRAGLPDISKIPEAAREKDKDKAALQKKAIAQQRQDVFDSLARFLGMNYVVGIVPSELEVSKTRNEVLNKLEDYLKISARDIERMMKDAKARETNTSFMPLKKDIVLKDFDFYLPLRELDGVYFLSQGERIMLESAFRTYEFEPVVVWPNISREDANILDEKRFDLPGVGIQTGYVRQYERPDLYAHILGYLGPFEDNDEVAAANKEANKDYSNPDDPNDPINQRKVYSIDDRIGRTGVEYKMEAFLRGTKGGRSVEVDASGNSIGAVAGSERAPVPGDNVYLTIDNRLQEVTTKALQDEMNRIIREKPTSKDVTGAAVVMDVNTGEVLALVSLPSFNNNLFRPGLNEAEAKELDALLKDSSERKPLFNRAIAGQYPPGSTFKLITALAGLNEGAVLPNTTYNCNLNIYVPTAENPRNPNERRRFKCWGKHGPLDVVGAVKNSCDIYFYNVGQEYEVNRLTGKPVGYYEDPVAGNFFSFRGLGIDKLNQYMDMFGLGKPTGIELPGEQTGLLPTKTLYPKLHPGGNWSVGDSLTTSIGQGDVLMTPLQLCNMTATIANGGKFMRPRIIKKVVDVQGNAKVRDEPLKLADIGVKQVNLNTVKRGMLEVTQAGGTASSTMAGKMGKLLVAGKTGTAEYGESIGKDKDDNLLYATYAWFTCFAPYDKPQIAVTVLVATGNNVTEGATYAVPVAKTILEARFPDLVPQPTPLPGTSPSPGAAPTTPPPGGAPAAPLTPTPTPKR